MLGQICRFGVSGLINTVIDFSIFNILIYISGIHSGGWLALINILAVAAAAINSYYLNRNWTFNDGTPASRTQVIRFTGATLTGLLLNTLIVTAAASLVPLISLPAILSLNTGKILASVVSATWNFITYRSWVFPCSQVSPVMDYSFSPNLVSVIIPAYNESARLPRRLENLASILPGYFPVEIIVVDDGSNDQTLATVRSLSRKFPCIKSMSYHPNRGKGKAVQTGMLAARGEYLIYTDADYTFTASHINEMAQELKAGADIVIGCRGGCREIGLAGESVLRRVMGKTFNALVQAFLLPGITDTQCGLKGFRRAAAGDLFSRQTVRRFAFDVEILVLARWLGYTVRQLPVNGIDCAGSRVNCWLSPLQMAVDLIKIKTNLLTNRYALPGGNQVMIQWGLLISLFMAALAVRVPWLWEVPRFIDELKEVELAYLIYTGEALPLHNAAQDIGALHNYILALLFKLFGPSIYWPRLYVAVTGALTVVLLYHVARRLYDRKIALLAAALLLTNGMHILVTHMAWSNCTTPFFFTLALLVTLIAQERKSGGWLIVAGFLWGLTLQTHSSMVLFALITLAYTLRPGFRRETGLTGRYFAASLFAFMLAYANMIYFNIQTRGDSFRWLAHKPYALESQITVNHYFSNLYNLVLELIRSLGSVYTSYDRFWQYLCHPAFLIASLLFATGLYLNLRNKRDLSVWLLIGGIILIPFFNKRYDFYISTRYIMPLILIAVMMASTGAVHWIRALKKPAGYRTAVKAATAFMLLLVFLQLAPLYQYYRQAADTNASNRMAFDILSLAGDASSKELPLVLIDGQLSLENEPLPYLFTLRQQPFQVLASELDQSIEWLSCLQQSSTQRLVAVMNEQTFNQVRNLVKPSQVSVLDARIVIPSASNEHRQVYVVEIAPNRQE